MIFLDSSYWVGLSCHRSSLWSHGSLFPEQIHNIKSSHPHCIDILHSNFKDRSDYIRRYGGESEFDRRRSRHRDTNINDQTKALFSKNQTLRAGGMNKNAQRKHRCFASPQRTKHKLEIHEIVMCQYSGDITSLFTQSMQIRITW